MLHVISICTYFFICFFIHLFSISFFYYYYYYNIQLRTGTVVPSKIRVFYIAIQIRSPQLFSAISSLYHTSQNIFPVNTLYEFIFHCWREGFAKLKNCSLLCHFPQPSLMLAGVWASTRVVESCL